MGAKKRYQLMDYKTMLNVYRLFDLVSNHLKCLRWLAWLI